MEQCNGLAISLAVMYNVSYNGQWMKTAASQDLNRPPVCCLQIIEERMKGSAPKIASTAVANSYYISTLSSVIAFVCDFDSVIIIVAAFEPECVLVSWLVPACQGQPTPEAFHNLHIACGGKFVVFNGNNASEVHPRLAIQSNHITLDWKAGGVRVLTPGADCSLIINFGHEFFGSYCLFNSSVVYCMHDTVTAQRSFW